MHTLYTLQKTLKFTLKTLKNLPLHVSVSFLRLSSGGSWTVLCQVTKLRSVDIRSLWNCAVFGHMSLQPVCVCVWCSLLSETLSWKTLHDKVSLSKEHQTRKQTDCNDIRPQTAQFYNERISTDLNLVTWQSIVHDPHEDGLKNGTETCRGKFLSFFNVNFSAF